MSLENVERAVEEAVEMVEQVVQDATHDSPAFTRALENGIDVDAEPDSEPPAAPIDIEKGLPVPSAAVPAGPASPHSQPPGDARPWARWIVLAIGCIGGLLASIQSSALIIAFPKLVSDLDATIVTIIWVLLAYLLVVAAVVPITGKLGDIFGQQLLFNFGFLFFTLASFLSGFSQKSATGYDLIAYRCIQGIGGTFLFSNSVAIITNVFAPYKQVGIAQGCFQVSFAVGSVLGPVIGGAFAVTDWRWIFWFNVPPSALCTIFGFIFIRNGPWTKKETPLQLLKKFDYLGSVLLMAFLALLILVLTQAVVPDPRLSTTAGLVCLSVFAAVSLVAFCLVEYYVAGNPIIKLSLFRNKTFTVSLVGNVVGSFGRGNVTYGMIFFFQGPCAEDPLTAGINLIPLGLGIIITGFFAGALADRIGYQYMCIIGPVVSALGALGLALVHYTANYWLVAFALFVIGIGNGIFNSPNSTSGILSVGPQDRGVAAAIRLALTFLAQMIGIVITFALVLNSIPYSQLLSSL